MSKRYLPTSPFLRAVINDDIAFDDLNLDEKNLQLLIGFTRDGELANRDWSTMLLAQLQLDRADVRDALANAANDAEPIVRGEAILGLALLDRAATLPLL